MQSSNRRHVSLSLIPAILFLFSGLCLSSHASEIVSEKESNPFPGIRIVEREMTTPPQRIFAAYIDLEEPTLLVDATEPTRQFLTVEEWATKNRVLVAVNGDFMRFSEGTPHLYGDAVGGGKRWPLEQTGRFEGYSNQWFFNRYGWVAFGGEENAVAFSYTKHVKENPRQFSATHGWKPDEVTHEIPRNTRALVSGFSQLVVEGKPITCDDPTASSCFPDRTDMRARHPRTAMGLTEDLKTFILVVVDGRTPHAAGMYGSELAELMHDLGSWMAINLDGGGSSQMYVKGHGIINTPSTPTHRKVLNHWGIFPRNQRN
jgi:exopolysaccharide biosynthesis protein